MEATNETGSNPAGAQSSAKGATLSGKLERLGKKAWTRSLSEEVLSVLWIIAAILSFGFHFDTMGWVCTVKALMDTLTALWFALREAIDDRRYNAMLNGAARRPLELKLGKGE